MDIYFSGTTGKTVTAQLYAGAQTQGSPFALAEIGATGEYVANLPGGTPAGRYLVVITSAGAKAGSGLLDWDGAAEVRSATQAQAQAIATAVGTPLQAGAYSAPDNAAIAAIKAKTDTLQNADLSGVPSASAVAGAVWASSTRSLTQAAGLTDVQAEQLRKVAQLHGLGVPLTVTATRRTAGDVQQTITTAPDGATTVSAA